MTDTRERHKKTKYISKKVLDMRKSTGWTQAALANRAGITSAAISQIEKGDRLPSLLVSRQLAHAFNISLEQLTGDAPNSWVLAETSAQTFFRKYQEIEYLTENDQNLIIALVRRLRI